MSTFSIFGKNEINGLIEKFSRRQELVRQELANATNKAAREVVNLSVAEWDSMMTAKDYAKPRITIVRGATANSLEARVVARTRATRANRFKHTNLPRKGGVHLNIRRGSPGGVLTNAFVIPRAKSDGAPLIMMRKNAYQKGEGRSMTTALFKAVYSPSVNQFFTDSRQRVAPEALSAAKAQFLRALQQ